MPTFSAHDGTGLAYRVFGEGIFAELFPNAELAVQPEAGHFPWLDDGDRFVAAAATFLG